MERIFSETDLKRELLEFELEEKLTILLGFSSSFNIKNNLNTLLISAQSNIQEPTRIVEEVKIELIELKENRQKIYEILCAVSKERTLEETEQLLNKVDKILAIFEAKKLKNDLFDNRNSTSIFKEEIDDLIKKIDDKISNIELEEDDNSFYKEKMNMLLDTDEESSSGDKAPIKIEKIVQEKEDLSNLIKYIDGRIKNLEEEYNKEQNIVPEIVNIEPKIEAQTTEQKDLDTLFNPFEKEQTQQVLEELPKKASYVSPLTRDEVDVFIKRIDDKLAELKKEEDKINVTKFDMPVTE